MTSSMEAKPSIQVRLGHAEHELSRATARWLDSALKDVDFMIQRWDDRIRSTEPNQLHHMLESIAGDMAVVSETLGFLSISSAAIDLLTSILHLEINFDHEDARKLAVREAAIGSHMSLLHARILMAMVRSAEIAPKIAA